MKNIFTLLSILALAAPLARAEEKAAEPAAAAIPPRCSTGTLDALDRSSSPQKDFAAFVTASENGRITLRIPSRYDDDKINLGQAPDGNALCPDEVWRYILRDRSHRTALKEIGLRDQVLIVRAANDTFQQVDELVAKIDAAAAEVYVQASTMDIISVTKKPVTFGFQAPVEVQQVAAKDPNPVMDPADYEAALLSIIQPKKDNPDVAVPGSALQAFYKSLLDLRAKLREMKLGTYDDEPGLKEESKTPETLYKVMRQVADCDSGRDDVEKGRKLNCWTDKESHREQTLGNVDLFTRNFVGSHWAQTAFVYAQARRLVEVVGPDKKKRTIRDLLAQIDQLKEANKVKRTSLRLIEINNAVFSKIGQNLFDGGKGVDDLRTAWASKGEAWQKAHPEVKKAIDAVDGMQGAQLSGGTLLFKEGDKEVLYGKDIDVLSVQPSEVNGISGQVADRLMKGDKWGATFQAAYAAVFGAPAPAPKPGPAPAPKPAPAPTPAPAPKPTPAPTPAPAPAPAPQTEPLPPLPAPRFGWFDSKNDPQALREGYERALADKSAADAKARMASQEQRMKVVLAAVDAKNAAIQDAEQDPLLSPKAKADARAQAEATFKEAAAKANAERKAAQAQQAKNDAILKGWSDQANQKIAALYNDKLLKLVPSVAQDYKGGWRLDKLAADTGIPAKFLIKKRDNKADIIQEYFDKDWSGDAATEPLKSNLIACQKYHGFLSARPYVSPTDYSVADFVYQGLVEYCKSQKGQR